MVHNNTQHTDGHCNSKTESAEWADSVKILVVNIIFVTCTQNVDNLPFFLPFSYLYVKELSSILYMECSHIRRCNVVFCSWCRDFLCSVNSTLNYEVQICNNSTLNYKVQFNALSFDGAKQCFTGSRCSRFN